MAKETPLTLFLGTDHAFVHTVLNDDEDEAIDIAGWTLSFLIKRSKAQADAAALLALTTADGISISGVFNVDPAVNTQVATVSVEDADTDNLAPGGCRWELKRMDAGLEAVLGYGSMTLVRGVHRS